MLFKHGHLEKKLREHGKQARAEILSIKTEGQGSSMRAMFADDSDLTTGWFLCRLDLRVMPSGEPPFKTRVHTRRHTRKTKGDMVPVPDDPNDHDSDHHHPDGDHTPAAPADHNHHDHASGSR